MPKCDTCGFSHAQPNHCINCGNPDPFRRHRVFKLAIGVALAVVGLVLVAYFYSRYTAIEQSVRQAQEATEAGKVFATPGAGQP